MNWLSKVDFPTISFHFVSIINLQFGNSWIPVKIEQNFIFTVNQYSSVQFKTKKKKKIKNQYSGNQI